MKSLYRLFLFLITHFVTQVVYAQQTPLGFNLIKKNSGITLGKINSITQDKYGYMWFAESGGNNRIIRFDGYKMKSYKYDPTDSSSLDRGGNECIAADSTGCIWTNAASGVDKFDPITNKFIHYRYQSGEIRGIQVILIDHLGIVWLGTDKGLDRLDQKAGKFIHYTRKDNGLSCDTVRCLYEDREGVLWVGTGWEFDPIIKEGGLNRLNRETGKFTSFVHDPNNPLSLAGNKVRAIFEDSRGVFWVGTDGDGLHTMNRKTGTFERLTYDPKHPEKLSRPPIVTGKDFADHITFIIEDALKAIWIGTWYAGIVRYDPATKEIIHFDSTDKSRPNGFTDNNGWCAYTSRDGNLWISTEHSENGGANLFRIDPLHSALSSVNMGAQVNNVYEDSSGITWMCLEGKGLLRMGRNKNDKKYFQQVTSDPYSISSNTPNFIKPDINGFFWVGTMNGLNHFDSKTGRFTKYLYNEISRGDFKDTAVFNLLKDDNGEIYITTLFGFFIMNPKTGLLKRYVNNASDTSSISDNFTTGLCKDKSGNIWIGTWSNAGLNLMDIKTKKFDHYLPGMIITNIYNDTRGITWVGTSNGLYYRNDSADIFTPVSQGGAAFRTAFIYSVGLQDEEENIWGFSSLGIFRFNQVKNELCIYGKKIGINNFDFNQLNKTKDGRFYLRKEGGYYAFDPKNLLNHTAPQVILTDFKIDGHYVDPGKEALYKGPIEETKEIKLQYNQNSFSLDFAPVHYSSPENNLRYYMLQGYDTNWIKVDSLNVADYRNIPTGKYVFKIKAASSYGVWSQTAVEIIISPPWWLTWWAFALYIFAFSLSLWGFNKWRTQALENENRLLEKKVALRTQELKKEKEIVESTLSELKLTQTQLIQSEKMASLGELTSGIAHEIKNPLNFINNFSEINMELISEIEEEQIQILSESNRDEITSLIKMLRKNSEKINSHGKRIDEIVKGMLQHSRLGNINKEPVNINALCDESLKLAYYGFRAKEKAFNVSFETHFDPELPKIMVIPQDLGRVILNLINNAFYTVNEKKKRDQPDSPDTLQAESLYKPSVMVSTKKTEDKILITISDNGMGISPQIINKIFQPFFTTKPTGEGTGLGLSMSYDIITKSHGGELRVKSKEGIGTDFEVVLPI